LIGNGEQSGTWGQTTNNNMGTLIEQAIAGVEQITLTGNKTLTSFNGLSDEARNAVLVFGGSLASPANVIAPAVQKTYIITNNSGANVTIKTATGNGVTILNGLNSLVYCDGNDFYTAVNVNNVIGDLTVSGNETIGGSLTLGGNITLANTVTASNLAMTANSGIITMASNTGAFLPPTGTSAQRPSLPTVGMSRWNTDLGVYEIYNGVNWQIVASGSYSGTYLVVAGGGGGSSGNGGGGGAGGLLTSSINFTSGTTYTITVGAGGSVNTAGNSSSITGIATAIGGGFGAGGTNAGGNGGSGGGASATGGGTPPTQFGGSATTGQGNAGGNAGNGVDSLNSGGGGGGAGAGGANGVPGNPATGGNGGVGLQSSITGVAVFYAGGGGGSGSSGATNSTGGSGGNGGGGTGGLGNTGGGSNGTANTGGGGGGFAGSGGSGVVILSVPTVSYTGTITGSPTITTSGANTILRFNSSGSYTA